MYKNFLVLLVVGVITALLLHAFLFMAVLGKPIERERYVAELFRIKESYAAQCSTPKTVVIAGSSTLFSVDAGMMEKELGIPVVNYGTHAGLGRYILERSKRILHEGDIVILPLEYVFYEDWHYEGDFVPLVAGYDPAYVRSRPMMEQVKMASYYPTVDLVNDLGRVLLVSLRPKKEPVIDWIHANGDMEHAKFKGVHQESRELLESRIKERVFRQDNIPSIEAQDELQAFLAWCRSNHIRVFAAWPPYLYHGSVFEGADAIGMDGIRKFYEAEGIPILGEYTDTLYPVDLFFDTIYHLNEQGRERHTRYILEELRKEL